MLEGGMISLNRLKTDRFSFFLSRDNVTPFQAFISMLFAI